MSAAGAAHPCVVAPSGAVRLEASWRSMARGAEAGRARALASGTPVALWASGPLARLRGRSLARRAGLVVEREYVVLPTASNPTFYVEDSPTAMGWFTSRVLTPPPGLAVGTGMVGVALAAVRALAPSSLLGALAPSRLAIGYRP